MQGNRTPGDAQREAVDALIARLQAEGHDAEAVAHLVAQRALVAERAAELARIGEGLTRAVRSVADADVPRLAAEAMRRLSPLAGVDVARHPTREQVRSVPCSLCGARAGDRCRGQNGALRKANHRTRVERWRDREWLVALDGEAS